MSPVAFEILIALASGDQHGYAILQDIRERTRGRLRLHAGSLYRALARLVEAGWVDELDERPDEDDARRRYYRLTAAGRRAAAQEANRLQVQLRAARARQLLERPESL